MSKCKSCNESLYLSDVESNIWHDNYEEFVLTCSYCGEKNFIQVKLFDDDGHISRYNFEILKKEKQYLPERQLKLVSDHLNNCQQCSATLNDYILDEIETKIKFNDKTLNFFQKNGKEVFKQVQDKNNFEFEEKQYTIKEEDLFFKDDVRTCYYLRFDYCLAGLVSFLNSENNIIEKIWLRNKDSIVKERKFFQDLKDKKIKLELQTLEAIFKRIR